MIKTVLVTFVTIPYRGHTTAHKYSVWEDLVKLPTYTFRSRETPRVKVGTRVDGRLEWLPFEGKGERIYNRIYDGYFYFFELLIRWKSPEKNSDGRSPTYEFSFSYKYPLTTIP